MALRSVIRKMPALGLRSPLMGPLMGPLRALSPAAGSRFMSHGGPGVETIIQDELVQARAEANRSFYKGLEQMRERRLEFSQVVRADIEKDERTKKTLNTIMMASNAVIIFSVPATLYLLNYF